MSKFFPRKAVFKEQYKQNQIKVRLETPRLEKLSEKIVELRTQGLNLPHEDMTQDELYIYNKYLRTKDVLIANELNLISSRKEKTDDKTDTN